jgi:hypothetical protein
LLGVSKVGPASIVKSTPMDLTFITALSLFDPNDLSEQQGYATVPAAHL